MNRFILKGDVCYAAAPNTLITRENSYLLCENGVCAGVLDAVPEDYRALPLIDYSGKLILPGMTDLHLHAPQYAYRGLGMDMELLEWLNAYAFPEESKYHDLSYADRAYTLFADALRHSVTTRAVIFGTLHREATELLMDKLEDSGVVSYVGKVNMDRNSPDNLCEASAEASVEDTERFLKETIGRYHNTYPILTPRFIPSCSDALLQRLGELSRRYNVPIQSHLSENPGEIAWVEELCPWADSYGAAYDRFHLFGNPQKTVMAHCVWSDEGEIALMEQNGVYIAHCPASNANVASGIAPVRTYLDRGMHIGLGSDIAGGQSESLFDAMTEALKVSRLYWRLVDSGKKPLSLSEVFYMATKGGGAFFGKVGSFEPGYEFDALVIDDSTLPHPQELTLAERLERAVILGGDRTGLVAKYVRGNQLLPPSDQS